MNVKNKTILFNGFTSIRDFNGRFIKVFKDQDPQNLKFAKFVPAGIEGFCAFGISNINTYISTNTYC